MKKRNWFTTKLLQSEWLPIRTSSEEEPIYAITIVVVFISFLINSPAVHPPSPAIPLPPHPPPLPHTTSLSHFSISLLPHHPILRFLCFTSQLEVGVVSFGQWEVNASSHKSRVQYIPFITEFMRNTYLSYEELSLHVLLCVCLQWMILWLAMILMRVMHRQLNPTATVISRLMEMRTLTLAVTGTKVEGHRRSADMNEVTATTYIYPENGCKRFEGDLPILSWWAFVRLLNRISCLLTVFVYFATNDFKLNDAGEILVLFCWPGNGLHIHLWCRNCGPQDSEPRAIKGSLMSAWSWSENAQACFAYCQDFSHSHVSLPGSFNFIFTQTSGYRPVSWKRVDHAFLHVVWWHAFSLIWPPWLTGHYY